MSTLTSRLGLYKPATTEFYNVITDQNNNWDSLDAFVGFVPSTSATRPASAFNGMSIRETDTGRLWVSDGSAPSSGSWKTQPLVSNVPASAALTTDLVLRQRVGTEANDRMNIRGDGRIQWGPGTAAVDTNLYRSAASVLRTDDAFQALRFINPITKSNWEGVGVTPDLPVPADQAFDTAYRMALEAVLAGLGEAPNGPRLRQAETIRERLDGPSPRS